MKKLLLSALFIYFVSASVAVAAEYKLLNVSYDATRELFQDYNQAFSRHYKEKFGDDVTVSQSHGGSAVQARSVVDGIPADVVSLSIELDLDYIAEQSGKIEKDWVKKFPNNSAPFTSAIIFLVRKGNPKGIHDWSDLIEKDAEIITPNPKTSAIARYNYLAAYAYADAKYNGDENKIKDFITTFYSKVPVLDTAVRGATNTFVQKNIGDVLLTWENEAHLSLKKMGADKFEIVVPSISIIAKPQVAVVTENAKKHGTLKVAEEYVNFLYSDEGQEIIAKHYYRPSNPDILNKHKSKFVDIKLVDVDKYGGLRRFGQKHFADGAWFDQILQKLHK